jgi:branched-chain amino acid transport system ATP-binding protein
VAAVSLLETAGLSRHFGGLKAVDAVDFTLAEGEIRAIIGPNGAGKTTFVSLLSGRIPASAGSVHFRGEDVTALPAWRRVGRGIAYTFQITNVFARLTAEENVALAAQSHLRREVGRFARIPPHLLAERVDGALAAVGLAGRAGTRASELAYGHQRLLEVAMGLALEPALLILDEPTQGLSDAEIDGFCDLVGSIAETATVLLIEHNMPVVMRLAGRITVMNRGRVLAEGTPGEIRENADVQAAYLGT